MRLIGRPFWTRERGGQWAQKYRDESSALKKLRVPRDVAPTKSAAHARAAAEWVHKQLIHRASSTIAELASKMLSLWTADDRLAASTRADREGHLRLHILPTFGGLSAEALTLQMLRAWVRIQRSAGASRSAINNRLSSLATLLDDAAAEGLTTLDGTIARHAAVRRELPDAPVVAPKTIGVAAFITLVSAPTTPLAWAVRYALAALAGLEDGVIAGLKVADIDGHVLCVRRAVAQKGPAGWASVTKTKNAHRGSDAAPRRVPVHRELAQLLQEWLSAWFLLWVGRSPRPDDFVLPQADGRAWRPASAEKLRQHMELAGALYPDGFTFHDLRGTFLTWLAALNVPSEQRKRLAGHAGDVQAEHYLGPEALLEADRAAIDRIPVKVTRGNSDQENARASSIPAGALRARRGERAHEGCSRDGDRSRALEVCRGTAVQGSDLCAGRRWASVSESRGYGSGDCGAAVLTDPSMVLIDANRGPLRTDCSEFSAPGKNRTCGQRFRKLPFGDMRSIIADSRTLQMCEHLSSLLKERKAFKHKGATGAPSVNTFTCHAMDAFGEPKESVPPVHFLLDSTELMAACYRYTGKGGFLQWWVSATEATLAEKLSGLSNRWFCGTADALEFQNAVGDTMDEFPEPQRITEEEFLAMLLVGAIAPEVLAVRAPALAGILARYCLFAPGMSVYCDPATAHTLPIGDSPLEPAPAPGDAP